MSAAPARTVYLPGLELPTGYTSRNGVLLETEASFQRWLESLADVSHCEYFHDNDSRRNRAGFLDTWIVTPGGLLLAAELKREDTRPSKAQLRWIEALGRVNRIHTGWFRPSQRPELERLVTDGRAM